MLFTILGAIVFAVAVCGSVALVFRTIKRPIPKGVIPLLAGVSIVGFTAYNENSWYSRQLEALPESVQVIRTGEFSNFIQPWTMIWPRVNRYLAVDTRNVAQVPDNEAVRFTEIIVAERYTPTRVINQFINCETLEAATGSENALKNPSAEISTLNWYGLGEADGRLIAAVCD
ncbi:MAG: hypothetical protein AAGI92_03825 [Pseudomonadota bacterium]